MTNVHSGPSSLQACFASVIFKNIQAYSVEKPNSSTLNSRAIRKSLEKAVGQLLGEEAPSVVDIRTRADIAIGSLSEKKLTRNTIPQLVSAMASKVELPASGLATSLAGGKENILCSVQWMDDLWYHSKELQSALSNIQPLFKRAYSYCSDINEFSNHVRVMTDKCILPLVPIGTLQRLLVESITAARENEGQGKLSLVVFTRVLVYLSCFGTNKKNISNQRKLEDNFQRVYDLYFDMLSKTSPLRPTPKSVRRKALTTVVNQLVPRPAAVKEAQHSSPLTPSVPLSGFSSSCLRQNSSPRPSVVPAKCSLPVPRKLPRSSAHSSASQTATTSITQTGKPARSFSTALSILGSNSSRSKSNSSNAASTLKTREFTTSELMPSQTSMDTETNSLTMSSPAGSILSTTSLFPKVTRRKESLKRMSPLSDLPSEVKSTSLSVVDIVKITGVIFLLTLAGLVGLDVVGQLDGLPRSFSSGLYFF